MGLLSVPTCLQTKQLPSSITGGEAIIILLDTTEWQLYHLSGPVCNQVQGVIRAGAARAFVVAATAVVPVTVVSTVVFAPSWLWLLLLRHGFLPIDKPAGHPVAHGSHLQVSTAAHHADTAFTFKAEWPWAIPVL